VLLSKAAHSLVSGDASGINELASINYSPDEFTALGQSTQSNMTILHNWGCHVWAALAFERFGQSERALAFAAKSLEMDPAAGGNPNQWLQSFALSCRGRILAALGDAVEAEAAFENALAVVAGREYWFIEACSVHDLLERVLRPARRGVADGEARLAAAVSKVAAT
jgi:tetratricopeptide (TPR) repeat protein